ncbi:MULTISPECIES: hypothetical protein [unclassified Devosia]|nr:MULTISPECIES: hypothetical protein [unclassified Devosia]
MSMTVLIVGVLAFFGTFAGVIGYVQYQTRGMAAPGSLPVQ